MTDKIQELFDEELIRASKIHKPFTTAHEVYGVLKEEIEEVEEELQEMKSYLENVWKCVRHDEDFMKEVFKMRQNAIRLAVEVIQVGAMCQKTMNYFRDRGASND